MGVLRFIGNVIWFLTGGLVLAVLWFLGGILLCITIIGIPFGRQCFKYASLQLFPFGKSVVTNYMSHPIANTFWLIFFGIAMAISYIVSAIVLCVTIVGIPFALQSIKFAALSVAPFGANVTNI